MAHNLSSIIMAKYRQASGLIEILSELDEELVTIFADGYQDGTEYVMSIIQDIVTGKIKLRNGEPLLYWFDLNLVTESFSIDMEDAGAEAFSTEESNIYESGVLWGIQDGLGKLGIVAIATLQNTDTDNYVLQVYMADEAAHKLSSEPFFRISGDEVEFNHFVEEAIKVYSHNTDGGH